VPSFDVKGLHIVNSTAGFTTVVAVDFGPDGLIYALELSDQAGNPTPGVGKVVRVNSSGVIEDVVTGLSVPTGMTFGPDGALYVSNFGSCTRRSRSNPSNRHPAWLVVSAFVGAACLPNYRRFRVFGKHDNFRALCVHNPKGGPGYIWLLAPCGSVLRTDLIQPFQRVQACGRHLQHSWPCICGPERCLKTYPL
jgi:hypothetical protein